MIEADSLMNYWDSSRDTFLRAIIRGVMQRPSINILSMYRTSFRGAFQAEQDRLEFTEEINRLNKIDLNVFN